MRRRILSALALAALTAAGLSACTTKVGAAAIVDGYRISDSDVAGYVALAGPTDAVKQAADQQGQRIEPKVQALSTLIQAQVFTAVLKGTSGVPTDAQLAAQHDEAVQRLLGAAAGGDKFDQQLITQARSYGFTKKFAGLVVRTAELENELVNQIKASSLADIVAFIGKHPVSVNVSKRYGTWTPSSLSLSDDPAAGLPGFVTFAPTPTLQAPAP